tara:strand:+ start:354 stop:881 length:528 start_codon:yes stop_codon:yes gene_type:complete
MGQEFFIKSDTLESKVRQLLPSQGGLGAGQDLSASTTIVPIVNLTEAAEGSTLRQDLQTSFSLNSVTRHDVSNETDTVINNTGYFRVTGNVICVNSTSGSIVSFAWQLTDGATTKNMFSYFVPVTATINTINFPYDFVVFMEAGDSLVGTSSGTNARAIGVTRQIADITGELVNP